MSHVDRGILQKLNHLTITDLGCDPQAIWIRTLDQNISTEYELLATLMC